MPRARPPLARRAISLAVGFAALVLGFAAFTALGLGGSAQREPGPPPPSTGPVIVIDPAAVGQGDGLVARSESIGVRESGGAGDLSTPELSEKVPFTAADFERPIASYRRYAARQVRQLALQASTLTASIGAADRAGARRQWREAFATYTRLGGAYGAFGAAGDRIAGLPGGLPRGMRDPQFTGLHRIAETLWGTAPVGSLRPVARQLEHDIALLGPLVRSGGITPLDYALRAHEIMEDAQRGALTGDRVPWSNEGVLATAAALDATQTILRTLHPLLKGQQVDGATQAGVARLRRTLATLQRAHGGALPSLAALDRAERQRLNASTGWLLERLQHVPSAVETTDPPPIPQLPKP